MTAPRPGAADPSEVPGLGPWRQHPLPAGFTPFPDEAVSRSIAARFSAVAAVRSDHLALSSPSGRWTYEDLEADVLERAGAIRARLGGARRPVAVLAAHDGPLVVAILSVIAAGGIVVVLDPLAPSEQIDHVLLESQAVLLVHDEMHAALAERASAAAPGTIEVVDFDALVGPALVDLPDAGPNDPVMLAFTSGTSGAPKAAEITNGVLLNLVRGATNALGIGPDDRMPMLFPTSLAVAAYPMFLPLLNGGTLATLDVRSVGLAPIGPFLVEERITLAYLAPTVVRFLEGSLEGRTFPDLRMVALGGEVVDAEVVDLTAKLLGPTLLANGFGTTETGVITLHVFDPAEVPTGVVPAGHPVPDVDLLVLDAHGDAVAPGTSGEVAIATPHAFTGYWGHHDLDAQVLAPDPAGRSGWKLYRTGDLGTIDEHGALTVLGRLDTKVKVRGRFVVLGDVEASVQELADVAGAVVVPTTVDGIVELSAVVMPVAGAALSGPDLRARLLASHEPYRVPSRWIVVDALPHLPNGKVDRRAASVLANEGAAPPAPVPTIPEPATPEPLAARSSLEAGLQDVWRRLLPVGPVGLDEDFFHLGGHSLLAAQMLIMVEEELGTAVPMSTLVHARTVRQVAAVIERIRAAGDRDPSTVACVQPGDPSRPVLWFVHDLPGSAYRIRHLAEHLGADQPVWSFESPLLRGERNSCTDLEGFVARYVADLRAAQPVGPYWLAGYSFGGIAAYEMARQLSAGGHEVAFVGVVDVGPGYRGPSWAGTHSPPWPYFGVPRPPAAEASAAEVVRHYVEMARTNPRAAARHLSLRTGLARRFDAVRFERDLRERGQVRPAWRLWYAWEQHWKLAARAWDRTSSYPGAVDLFWASQTGSVDSSMGWEPMVAELRIHRFDGVHEGILEEHGAPALARSLRAAIDARRRDGDRSAGP